jgi:hypothetical protein
MNLSDDQKKVIECIKENKSVIIDAVAGSGKTTTIMNLAKELPTRYILQITYNAHLKKEVKEKVFKEEIENLEVHTYHSLCLKYYRCYKDEQIKNLLEYKVEPKKQIPKFSVLVIDEVQDMRSLYYNVILKFLTDLGYKVPIVIAGDKYQGIYEFSDADTRFLTLADKIHYGTFTRLDFQTSYRVTQQVATFLNAHIIGYNRIVSGNTNPATSSVKYIICNKEKDQSVNYIINEIVTKLNSGYKSSDFFIMSYSIKHNNFLKQIENILSSMKIYVYYENSDEEKTPDSKLIENKLVFTTIHCSKGRERKFVFFDGFDSSFDYYCKKSKKNPKLCPSELYVALTRASQELYLIHNSKKSVIGCLTDYSHLASSKYVKIIYLDPCKPQKEYGIIKNIFSVSDLLNHLGSTIVELAPKITELFDEIVQGGKVLRIKDTIEDTYKNTTENVTDINGLVIPMIFESLQNLQTTGFGDCYILQHVKEKIGTILNEKTDLEQIKKIKEMMFNKKTKIQDYITIGILYSCICSKLLHKNNQIVVRDWLDMDDVKECHTHLSTHLSAHPKWEQNLGKSQKNGSSVFIFPHPKFGDIEIYNRIDAIDDNNVWELKCVNLLTIEHKLQLIIYYFIYTHSEGNKIKRNFKLLNMKSGEVLQLKTNETEKINYIVERVFETKVLVKDKVSDDIFLNICKESKYYLKVSKLKENEVMEEATQFQKLDRLDITKLREKAKNLGIKKYSGLNKGEIIEEIVACMEKIGKYKKVFGMF